MSIFEESEIVSSIVSGINDRFMKQEQLCKCKVFSGYTVGYSCRSCKKPIYTKEKAEEVDRLRESGEAKSVLRLVISDEERSHWIDGEKLWWEVAKDDRPDWNPYEYGLDEQVHQIFYKLDEMAREFPLNEVPAPIVEALARLKHLEGICNDYARHVLGLILKERTK